MNLQMVNSSICLITSIIDIILQKNNSMKRYKYIGFLIALSCFALGACDADYSKSRMPDRPTIDESFFKVSIAAIDQSIESKPNNDEAYFKKARILAQLNNHKAARINIEKAIELDPKNAEYAIFLADNLFQNNEFQKGLAVALRARSLGLNTAELNYLLAGLYLKNNEPDKAMDFNRLALEVEITGNYFNQRGEIFLAKLDTAAAMESFKNATKLDAYLGSAYDKLTKLFIKRQKTDSALHYLRVHRSFAPDNLRLWYDQGILYRMLKKDDSAKYTFRAIIAKDSLAARSMVKMSEIFFDKYKYDSAQYFADKAIAVRSTLKPAMLMQARILARKRYYNQARQKFDAILTMDSTYQEAIEEKLKMERSINYYRKLQQEREENMQVGTIAPKKIKPE